jgi:hypothetical protein
MLPSAHDFSLIEQVADSTASSTAGGTVELLHSSSVVLTDAAELQLAGETLPFYRLHVGLRCFPRVQAALPEALLCGYTAVHLKDAAELQLAGELADLMSILFCLCCKNYCDSITNSTARSAAMWLHNNCPDRAAIGSWVHVLIGCLLF